MGFGQLAQSVYQSLLSTFGWTPKAHFEFEQLEYHKPYEVEPSLQKDNEMPVRYRGRTQEGHVRRLNKNHVARWDQKRDRCRNCKRLHLKFLSPHPGYCSVDCKSNAMYLHIVNQQTQVFERNDFVEHDLADLGKSPKNDVHTQDKTEDDTGSFFFDHAKTHTQPKVIPMERETFADFHTEKLTYQDAKFSYSAFN